MKARASALAKQCPPEEAVTKVFREYATCSLFKWSLALERHILIVVESQAVGEWRFNS